MERKLFNKVLETCKKIVNDYSNCPEDVLWDAFNKLKIEDEYHEEVEYIKENTYPADRWSIPKEEIIKVGNWYISFGWSQPATEMQEGQATFMEIYEVFPKEETVIKYVTKEALDENNG